MGWVSIVIAIAGGLLGLVALFLAVMYFIGRSMPPAHRHTCRVRLGQPIDAVYERIADVTRWPEWDRGVNRVEASNAAAPKVAFAGRMYMGRNVMSIVVRRTSPSKRLEIEVEDLGAKIFSGVWKYELSTDGANATRITLTEEGEIHAAIPRAMARTLADPMLYLKRHLRVLGESFGEKASLEGETVRR